MPKSTKGGNTLKIFALDKERAIKVIRAALEPSGKLILTDHVKQRIVQRQISDTEIRKVLRQMDFNEGPYKTTKGDYKCELHGWAAGRRLGVVIAIDLDAGTGDYIVVVTTMELN